MPPTATEPTVRNRIEIRPVTASVGAELVGLDLAAALDDAAVAEIEAALVRWKVVFIRGQQLDAQAQIAFAGRLGPLTTGHPTVPSPEGLPLVFQLDSLDGGRADHWHTDVTFTANPPAISVLRAIELPELGGDTMWADTEGAYERLPEPLRHLAGELRVVHTNAYDYGQAHGRTEDESTARHRAVFRSQVFETEHPMVRVHPVSGRPGLLLGGFAQRIVGLPTQVGADLLRIFQSYVLAPEHLVRWRWADGDVAIWDNRSTQHYAVNDYGQAHRRMQRVTVAGGPVHGPDGRTSQALRGDDTTYLAGVGAGAAGR